MKINECLLQDYLNCTIIKRSIFTQRYNIRNYGRKFII
jgi:hypothetical protein